jgi:XTP/dITP diphosphohydrolase
MIPPRVVVASANAGKVSELRMLVAEWGDVEALSLVDFPGVRCPEERETSYAENAVTKAQAVATATGLPAVADDSGLEVHGLGGAPGIRSARWASTDADRIDKLLAALRDLPEASRRAAFRCVVALAWPDGRVETAEGSCSGRIAFARTGSAGFGYDPVFVSDELGTTFAATAGHDKHRVSHRGRAMRALGARLGGMERCTPPQDRVR